MPDPTFTAPPTAPSRSDAPAIFIARADAFVAWFQTLYTQLVAFVTWTNAAVGTISTAVTNGLAAIDARVAAAGFKTTSATSRAVGTGSKVFSVPAGLSFAPGSTVIVADSAAPDVNALYGVATSYVPTTGGMADLTVNVTSFIGSGTKSAWNISIAGPQGAAAVVSTQSVVDALEGATLDADLRLRGFMEKAATLTGGAIPVTGTTGGSVFDLAVSSAITLSLSGLPGSPAAGDTFTVHGRLTITGTPVISWPGGIKWPNGVAPIISAGVWLLNIEAVWSGSAWTYYGSMTKVA